MKVRILKAIKSQPKFKVGSFQNVSREYGKKLIAGKFAAELGKSILPKKKEEPKN